MVRHTIFATLAVSALALPAQAQDAYVIGITGGLTGSSASTYAPTVEAVRLYIERVNAAGGVNGKQIRLVIQDDSAEPSNPNSVFRYPAPTSTVTLRPVRTPLQMNVDDDTHPVLIAAIAATAISDRFVRFKVFMSAPLLIHADRHGESAHSCHAAIAFTGFGHRGTESQSDPGC